MFFQKKKKIRLWRARVTQITPQFQTHHHHLQEHQYYYQQPQRLITNNYHQLNMAQITAQEQSDLPSDSSMIDGQENYTTGYSYESTGSTTDYEDEDHTMSSTVTMMKQSIDYYSQQQEQEQRQQQMRFCVDQSIPLGHQMINQISQTDQHQQQHSIFTNCIRNLCGAGCCTSTTDSMLSINNNNDYTNLKKLSSTMLMETGTSANLEEIPLTIDPDRNMEQDREKEFSALFPKLKNSQIQTLLQVVEAPTSKKYQSILNSTTAEQQTAMKSIIIGQQYQTDCILVPRSTIMGEEPNVIACRTWRWSDLRASIELKSIPTCSSKKDPIYVCCNPSHWSRLIVMLDPPPPPYQERLKPEDCSPSENMKGGGSTNTTTGNIKYPRCGLRDQFSGSLTTDGEDHSKSSNAWCQLAYWELAQRVGNRYLVRNSIINVYSDQNRNDGMCLLTLAQQRQTRTPDSVIKVRRKIDLGITLCKETDGIWLYNRSSNLVFIHSPTLNDLDNWGQVIKIPPGYCLKAFDYYRAQELSVWPPQIAGAQTGPVDKYSMRISFAKGWGPNYSRTEVTACPCWLEVILEHNR